MNKNVRLLHRYIGFFLSGVMIIYAVSGVIMVFRNTNYFKIETAVSTTLAPKLSAGELGEALHMRRLKVTTETDETLIFAEGIYHKQSGLARYTKYELPWVLQKFESIHKATTNSPLYFFNIFFGISLLFFAISSFFMYLPKTKIFKRGLYFSLAGLILALVMIFV